MLGIKNNYVIQAKHFETGTTEDVLRWYITLQEIFEKKSCEDAEAEFGMVELLLGCQGKKDFAVLQVWLVDKNIKWLKYISSKMRSIICL